MSPCHPFRMRVVNAHVSTMPNFRTLDCHSLGQKHTRKRASKVCSEIPNSLGARATIGCSCLTNLLCLTTLVEVVRVIKEGLCGTCRLSSRTWSFSFLWLLKGFHWKAKRAAYSSRLTVKFEITEGTWEYFKDKQLRRPKRGRNGMCRGYRTHIGWNHIPTRPRSLRKISHCCSNDQKQYIVTA